MPKKIPLSAARFMHSIVSSLRVAKNEGMSFAPDEIETIASAEDSKTAFRRVLVDGKVFTITITESSR